MMMPCPRCNGAGRDPFTGPAIRGWSTALCQECGGAGEIPVPPGAALDHAWSVWQGNRSGVGQYRECMRVDCYAVQATDVMMAYTRRDTGPCRCAGRPYKWQYAHLEGQQQGPTDDEGAEDERRA